MSMVNDTQDLIEIGELCGRKVIISIYECNDVIGVLHSLSEHGALVREDNGSYMLVSWRHIISIEHKKQEQSEDKIESSISSNVQSENEEKIEIVDSLKTIVTDNLPNYYEWEWIDEDVEIMVTDEDGDECIDVFLDDKVVLLQSKDLELAKKIATKLGINRIEKDYEE